MRQFTAVSQWRFTLFFRFPPSQKRRIAMCGLERRGRPKNEESPCVTRTCGRERTSESKCVDENAHNPNPETLDSSNMGEFIRIYKLPDMSCEPVLSEHKLLRGVGPHDSLFGATRVKSHAFSPLQPIRFEHTAWNHCNYTPWVLFRSPALSGYSNTRAREPVAQLWYWTFLMWPVRVTAI